MDIEEDIKLINNFVQNIENGFVTSSTISSWNPEKRIVKAIEHILAEREEDKKKIEELEDENRVKKHQIMQVFDRGYIHKDKIRELINERQFELQQEYKDFKDDIRLNTLQEIYYLGDGRNDRR